jgi:putative membrane protein
MLMSSLKNSDEKILVLVADVDDDLGRHGFRTPIIGYDEVLKTAVEFGLRDPSDSDLNAIFHALKIYRNLREQGVNAEVAIICGEYGNTVKSSIKINRELEEIKKRVGFEKIYFVSDGAHDEQVIPILYNYGSVVGVERVIVTQARSIEETYILIGRYLKKALTEQPYTRYFLGIPGLLIIIYALASLVGIMEYAWQIIALVLGTTLMIHGFGFIDHLNKYWRVSPVAGFLYGISLFLITYTLIVDIIIARLYSSTVLMLKLMLNLTFYPFILGLFLFLGARIFYKVLSGSSYTIWKESVSMIPIIFFIEFIINLEQGLSSFNDSDGFDKIISLFSATSIAIPLMLAVLFTLALSVLFVLLDIIVLRRSSPTESTLS